MSIQSLHSNWQFQAPDSRWLPAEVPGCIHRDLRRQELIPDPFYGRNEQEMQWIEERDWSYQTTFVPTAELLQHEVIELVCEGLDTVAQVRLNGQEILRSENMFHRHRVPLTGKLVDGENRLEIRFSSAMEYIRTHRTEYTPPREFNDPIGNCVRIRKQQCQFGWDWGPRLVTAGIWRPIFLEAWTGNRLNSVRVEQHHSEGAVELAFTPELARAQETANFDVTVLLQGEVVARASGVAGQLRASIPNPQLWWPAGHGAQPLYEVKVELRDGEQAIDSWQRTIGLRTIQLDMEPDEFEVKNKDGKALNRFGFRVNGRLIFCKGANVVPAHALVAGLTREDYEPMLRDAAAANMNMMRLWGGGIYENEAFYDLCDELGLLIWHDFMFACTLYPADQEFLDSVRREAQDHVTRIRHRASLALWCGNNELVALNKNALIEREDLREEYTKLFLGVLPEVLREVDPATPYIHTSPLYGIPGVPESFAPSEDAHDWNVWFSRQPVEYYETTNHRFNSEFGMQCYPSPHIAATFCPPEELNILSPTFEAHQRCPGGNAIIFHYVAQFYRFPKDYAALSYLSQLNQGLCMKTGIEHFRRQQPLCLGAMYWQLNDVWPVASWSGLEFGGNWKALHYYARRFFAPELVSIQLHGEDRAGTINTRINTRGVVDLWTVFDRPETRTAELSWVLASLDGEPLTCGRQAVELEYGQSRIQQTLDFTKELEAAGKDNAYLLAVLKDSSTGEELSRNTALFTAPRFLRLQREPIQVERHQLSPQEWELTLSAGTYHYGVCIEPGADRIISDNFFDLCPGDRRTVRVRYTSAPASQDMPAVFSLVDTY